MINAKIIPLSRLSPAPYEITYERFTCDVISPLTFSDNSVGYISVQIDTRQSKALKVPAYDPKVSVPINYVCLANSTVKLPIYYSGPLKNKPYLKHCVILHPNQLIIYTLVNGQGQLKTRLLVQETNIDPEREEVVNILPESAEIQLLDANLKPTTESLEPDRSYRFINYEPTEKVFFIQKYV